MSPICILSERLTCVAEESDANSEVDPAYRSATQLIAALKRGEYSAVELLEQTIQRIERLDGRINAIVVRYFERARAAAEESDRSLKSGDDRPLLGLPITVKESSSMSAACRLHGGSHKREISFLPKMRW